jgi:hypothetical protein
VGIRKQKFFFNIRIEKQFIPFFFNTVQCLISGTVSYVELSFYPCEVPYRVRSLVPSILNLRSYLRNTLPVWFTVPLVTPNFRFFSFLFNRAFKISHSTVLYSFIISIIYKNWTPCQSKRNSRFLNNPGYRIPYRTGMFSSNFVCHFSFQFICAIYSSVSIYLVENPTVFTKNKQRKTNSFQFLFSRLGQWLRQHTLW